MSNLDPVVQIGDWYYQVIYGQLWPVNEPADTEQKIRLEPRLHSLLNFFLLHPNTLLAKDTLIEKVWPADEGTDAAVMRAVGALRKVLGDDVRAPIYIATVSKKGYCWLAPIQSRDVLTQPLQHQLASAEEIPPQHKIKPKRWPWRFITVTALSIFIGCASLAFILASYTAVPLVKLPDTIAPISALSGQEYWPVLNLTQRQVIYQHKAPDSMLLNWSLQSLDDLKVQHLPQRYRALSEALWLDESHILFRAITTEQDCQFYRQKLQPVIDAPEALWPCQRVFSQGVVRWKDQWLWLDAESSDTAQLWLGSPRGSSAKLLLNLPHNWLNIDHLLVRDDTLFLLAQETQNNSALLQLALPNGQPKLVSRFSHSINQISWWDTNQLLLAPLDQELQILDLDNLTSQSLGPLTRELTQAKRYPGQVLATQYLDYTTDIFAVQRQENDDDTVIYAPWHVSNRSERLLAVEGDRAAFVSERAGHSQIWLAQGRNSTQLTRLNEQQQVQQLFWHQQTLLVLINSQLYRLLPDRAELQLLKPRAAVPGRYASCHNQLYWTELTDTGWKLFTEINHNKQLVFNDVVDVRCAPEQALVLQFVQNDTLSLLTHDRQLAALPVHINWREVGSEQWFTDGSGIYWLDKQRVVLRAYRWAADVVADYTLPKQQWPVAIYSNGDGLGYIVRPRPHDTDIVWLQNRR
jgi:DNA-binding winged helix-turn-helix (wHTH) protein